MALLVFIKKRLFDQRTDVEFILIALLVFFIKEKWFAKQ
jgi:hypothetical protein